MPLIDAARVLILATDGFEQPELFRTRERLRDLGAEVRIAALGTTPIRGAAEGRSALRITPDMTLTQVDCERFDALLIPGGEASAAALKEQQRALEIVRDFAGAGKPVAATRGGACLLDAAGVDAGDPSAVPEIRRDARLVVGGGAAQITAFTDALIEAIEGRMVAMAAR